jgi:5-formyltetrahydrofolate cyclo-ligase
MTNAPTDSAQQRKSYLRDAALARRDALEIDDRLEWDPAIAEGVLAILSGNSSPHPEEPRSGVSKDDPAVSRASSTILRDAIPVGMAPQDEGSSAASANGRGPVSAYWPMRSEADPRPILESLHANGVSLCLPAIVDRRMIFRRWAPWEPIVPGGFGTLVPEPQQPQVNPAILIVPLAAFDRRGYRIGYGKGYYDRALSELGPVTSIGIGYSAQEIEAVPDEPHDQRLDWIVTERETIRCG